MPQAQLKYHVFEETAGGYRLVKSYAHESSMRRGMQNGKPRWVVFTRRATLDNFSTLGMPNGYLWNGADFVDCRMPVRPIILK